MNFADMNTWLRQNVSPNWEQFTWVVTPETSPYTAQAGSEIAFTVLSDSLPYYGRYQLYDGPDVIQPKPTASNYFTWRRSDFVASFGIYPMIGCCGMVITTGWTVWGKYKHKGIGTRLNLLQIDMARTLGYTRLVATDVAESFSTKIFKANGWQEIDRFTNRRTGNEVLVWQYPLLKEK